VFRLVALFGLVTALAPAQFIQSEACPTNLCRLVAHGRAPDLRYPDFVDFRSLLVEFYAPTYSPVWLTENGPTPQALALIAILKAANLKGLKPEDYNADLWDEQIAHLDRSQFDVCLTVSVMRYLADLPIADTVSLRLLSRIFVAIGVGLGAGWATREVNRKAHTGVQAGGA